MRSNFIYSAILLSSLLALCTYGVGQTRSALKQSKSQMQAALPEQSPLYLPEAKKVRTVTLGFDQLASDILWFQTLNYFGKQIERKRDIPWLAHMCDLVTDLDRKAKHAFEFCSTLLSWVAKDPNTSVRLLDRAIDEDPNYWRYYYIRGFTHWYFLDDRKKAAKDLSKAAGLPDAPLFLSSLAGRMLASDDSPATAIRFLKNLIEQNKDPHAKTVLHEKLKLAYVSRDLKALQKQMSYF